MIQASFAPVETKAVSKLTHADLVPRAIRWLKGTVRCGFVLYEVVSVSREVPDAIGWKTFESYLVECKASRADFLKDKDKIFRKRPEYGMGDYRYYMTPPGLLAVDELPKNWGLLEVYPKQVRVVKHACRFDRVRTALNERPLLHKALKELLNSESESVKVRIQ